MALHTALGFLENRIPLHSVGLYISITVLCKDRRKVPGEAAFWRIIHLYALHIIVIEHDNTKTKARGLFFQIKSRDW